MEKNKNKISNLSTKTDAIALFKKGKTASIDLIITTYAMSAFLTIFKNAFSGGVFCSSPVGAVPVFIADCSLLPPVSTLATTVSSPAGPLLLSPP